MCDQLRITTPTRTGTVSKFLYTNQYFMEIAVIVFIVIAALCIYIYEQEKAKQDFLKKVDIDMSKTISLGKYVMGHPTMDLPMESTVVYKEGDILKFGSGNINPDDTTIKWLGEIPIESITNVSIEDASTMQKRVTLTRMALMGIFAFALQKNETSNLAYVIIEWKQKWRETELSHETIFEYNMPQASAIANISRNNLIRLIGE